MLALGFQPFGVSRAAAFPPPYQVQPSGWRVGAGSTSNYMSGPTGVGRELVPGTALVLGVYAPTDVVNNQHLIGFNSASGGGYQFVRSNGRVINLIWTSGTFQGVMTCYKDWNVLAVYRTLAGALRVSCNGEVTRAMTSPSGGYTNAGASGVFSLLKNAFGGIQPATENSIGYYAFVDANGVDIADASLQAWSGQANALDAWHAHPGVSGNANLVDFHSADDWDGSSSTWTGTGSAPVTLTKQGTLTKFVLPGYDWRDVDETTVSDSSGIVGTQGTSGETTGPRRSPLCQVQFTTDSADVNSAPGLRVEVLASSWSPAGQVQAGLIVNGTALAGNNVGLEAIPGGVPTAGYGLRRRLGAMIGGAGAKAISLIDGGQPLLGTAPQSQGTVTRVGVISGSSFAWTARATTANAFIPLFDSLGTQTEGVADTPGVKGPCYDSWPIQLRADLAATHRILCEGQGSQSWQGKIGTAPLRAATLAILQGLAIGSSTNTFWLALGTNDYGINGTGTYANPATLTSDLVLFLTALIALALPGIRIYVAGIVARGTETANTQGNTCAQIRSAIQAAVTTVGNAICTYHDATGAVSVGNRTDAQQLHWNKAGATEYKNFVRTTTGL